MRRGLFFIVFLFLLQAIFSQEQKQLVVVSTEDDVVNPAKGSLRWACMQATEDVSVSITFSFSEIGPKVIKLKDELSINGEVRIDGSSYVDSVIIDGMDVVRNFYLPSSFSKLELNNLKLQGPLCVEASKNSILKIENSDIEQIACIACSCDIDNSVLRGTLNFVSEGIFHVENCKFEDGASVACPGNPSEELILSKNLLLGDYTVSSSYGPLFITRSFQVSKPYIDTAYVQYGEIFIEGHVDSLEVVDVELFVSKYDTYKAEKYLGTVKTKSDGSFVYRGELDSSLINGETISISATATYDEKLTSEYSSYAIDGHYWIVTNTNSTGEGSLKWACQNATQNDTIIFLFNEPGNKVIKSDGEFVLGASVDGSSFPDSIIIKPGFSLKNRVPVIKDIVIEGNKNNYGITGRQSSSNVPDLIENCVIRNCSIGVNGAKLIEGCQILNNKIGILSSAHGGFVEKILNCVVSGNDSIGIAGEYYCIENNIIGLSPDQRYAMPNVVGILGNGMYGRLDTVRNNVISGNFSDGIALQGRTSIEVFEGNLVGTNKYFDSNPDLGNGKCGLSLSSGSNIGISYFSNNYFGNNRKYGVYNATNASLTIKSSYFGVGKNGNSMPNYVAGIYTDAYSELNLKNCSISNNGDGIKREVAIGQTTLDSCVFDNNSGFGVSINLTQYSGGLEITNSKFSSNEKSAVSLAGILPPTYKFSNNLFENTQRKSDSSQALDLGISLPIPQLTTISYEDGQFTIIGKVDTMSKANIELYYTNGELQTAHKFLKSDSTSVEGDFSFTILEDEISESGKIYFSATATYGWRTSQLSEPFSCNSCCTIDTIIAPVDTVFYGEKFLGEVYAIGRHDSIFETITLPNGCDSVVMHSLIVKPDPTKLNYYVKTERWGAGDGSSWENAMDGKDFAFVLPQVGDGVTFYVAEGEYDLKKLSTSTDGTPTVYINSPVTIIGGYPANAEEGAVSSPATHHTWMKTGYFRLATGGDVIFDGLRFESTYTRGVFDTYSYGKPNLKVTLKNSVAIGGKEGGNNNTVYACGERLILENDTIYGTYSEYDCVFVHGGCSLDAKNTVMVDAKRSGVYSQASNVSLDSCVISGNKECGIYTIDGNVLSLKNCIVGLSTDARSKKGNGVGINSSSAYVFLENNVIAGNEKEGIKITNGNTRIELLAGNYIGTNKDFENLGNGLDGLYLGGGTVTFPSTLDSANYIGFNGKNGIYTNGRASLNISCNYIGITAAGNLMPNEEYGVYFYSNATSNTFKNVFGYNKQGALFFTNFGTFPQFISENLFFGTEGNAIDLGGYMRNIFTPRISKIERVLDSIYIEGTTDTTFVSDIELFYTNGELQTAHKFLGRKSTTKQGEFSFVIPVETLPKNGNVCFSATATYNGQTGELTDPFCCDSCLCPTDTTLATDTLIAGEPFIDGVVYTVGRHDSIFETITLPNGCDSVVMHSLIVKPDPKVLNYYVKTERWGAGDGSSWENAMDGRDFAACLPLAPDGATFYVAEGEYMPDSEYSKQSDGVYFTTDAINVSIVGGFSTDIKRDTLSDPQKYETILRSVEKAERCFVSNSTNFYGVVFESPLLVRFPGNKTVTFDKCTFREIDAARYYTPSTGSNIVGHYQTPESIIEFRECQFLNNKSTLLQGYQTPYNVGVDKYYGCSFVGNEADILFYFPGLSGSSDLYEFVNCTFTKNKAKQYFSFQGGLRLYNNSFFNNEADVFLYDQSYDNSESSTIVGNVFLKNDFTAILDGGHRTTSSSYFDLVKHNLFQSEMAVFSTWPDNINLSGAENQGNNLFDLDASGEFVLKNNGGFTPTVALKSDRLPDGTSIRFPLSETTVTTDQRGVERLELTCMGAYELTEISRREIDTVFYDTICSGLAYQNGIWDISSDELQKAGNYSFESVSQGEFYTDTVKTLKLTVLPSTTPAVLDVYATRPMCYDCTYGIVYVELNGNKEDIIESYLTDENGEIVSFHAHTKVQFKGNNGGQMLPFRPGKYFLHLNPINTVCPKEIVQEIEIPNAPKLEFAPAQDTFYTSCKNETNLNIEFVLRGYHPSGNVSLDGDDVRYNYHPYASLSIPSDFEYDSITVKMKSVPVGEHLLSFSDYEGKVVTKEFVVIAPQNTISLADYTSETMLCSDDTGFATVDIVTEIPSTFIATSDKGYKYSEYIGEPGEKSITLKDLRAGKYRFALRRDVQDCSDEEFVEFEIKAPEPLELSLMVNGKICEDANLFANVSGERGDYNFHWIFPDGEEYQTTVNTIQAKDAGIYVCQVTDKNGCSVVTDYAELMYESQLSQLEIYNLKVDETCFSADNAAILILYTNNNERQAVTCELYNLDTDELVKSTTSMMVFGGMMLTNVTPGKYKYRLFYGTSECRMETKYIEDVIEILPKERELVINEPIITNQTCVSEPNGEIYFLVNGWEDSYVATWAGERVYPEEVADNGDAAFIIRGISGGQYRFNIEDDCKEREAYQDVNMPIYTQPILDVISATKELRCAKERTGEIVLKFAGGIPEFATFTADNQAVSFSVDGSYTFRELGKGTHVYEYKSNVSGCSDRAYQFVPINGPDTLSVDFSLTGIDCPAATLSAKAKGETSPYRYVWSDGEISKRGNSKSTFSVESGKTYSVTVSDFGGCDSYTESVYIPTADELPNLSLEVEPRREKCYGANNGGMTIKVDADRYLPFGMAVTVGYAKKGGQFKYEEFTVSGRTAIILGDNFAPGDYDVTLRLGSLSCVMDEIDEVTATTHIEAIRKLSIDQNVVVTPRTCEKGNGTATIIVDGWNDTHTAQLWVLYGLFPIYLTDIQPNRIDGQLATFELSGLSSSKFFFSVVDECENATSCRFSVGYQPSKVFDIETKTQTCLSKPNGVIKFKVSGWTDNHSASVVSFESGNKVDATLSKVVDNVAYFEVSGLKGGKWMLNVVNECDEYIMRDNFIIKVIEPYSLTLVNSLSKLKLDCPYSEDGEVFFYTSGGHSNSHLDFYEVGSSTNNNERIESLFKLSLINFGLYKIENCAPKSYRVVYRSDIESCIDSTEFKFNVSVPRDVIFEESVLPLSCVGRHDGAIALRPRREGSQLSPYYISPIGSHYSFSKVYFKNSKGELVDYYIDNFIDSYILLNSNLIVAKQENLALDIKGSIVYPLKDNEILFGEDGMTLKWFKKNAVSGEEFDLSDLILTPDSTNDFLQDTATYQKYYKNGKMIGDVPVWADSPFDSDKYNFEEVPATPNSNAIYQAGIQTIANLSTGTYIAQVEDKKGCVYRKEFVIESAPDALKIDEVIFNSESAACEPISRRIKVNVSGGWGGYYYSFVNQAENPESDNSVGVENVEFRSGTEKYGYGLSAFLNPGEYRVMVVDSNGCIVSSEDTYKVEAAVPIVEPDTIIPICPREDVTVSINVKGSATNEVYDIQSFSGIDESGNPTLVDFAKDLIVDENNNLNVKFSANPLGGVSTYGLFVKKRDAECSGYVEVTINDTLKQMNISQKELRPILCNGGSDGEIDFIVGGGLSPYSIIQYNKQNLSEKPITYSNLTLHDHVVSSENDGAQDKFVFKYATITDLGVGDYDFYLRDDRGCTQYIGGTLTMTEPQKLSAEFVPSGACPLLETKNYSNKNEDVTISFIDKQVESGLNGAILAQNIVGGTGDLKDFTFVVDDNNQKGEFYFPVQGEEGKEFKCSIVDINNCVYESNVSFPQCKFYNPEIDFYATLWHHEDQVIALIDICKATNANGGILVRDSVSYHFEKGDGGYEFELLDKRLYIYDIHSGTPEQEKVLNTVDTKTLDDSFFRNFTRLISEDDARHIEFIRLKKRYVENGGKYELESLINVVNSKVTMTAYFEGCAYEMSCNKLFVSPADEDLREEYRPISLSAQLVDFVVAPNIISSGNTSNLMLTVTSPADYTVRVLSVASVSTGIETHFESNNFEFNDVDAFYHSTQIIDLSGLQPGLYLITVSDDNNEDMVITKHVLIQ